MPSNLPNDINIELLMKYYPQGTLRVELQGLHKRNTYNDIIEAEERDDVLEVKVGRNSIYNALPEYMFHPIDRFDNLPAYEEKQHFEEQLEQQEEEIRKAYLFFAPIDVLLLNLRADVREKLEPFASENIVMQQIIGDTLTDEQQQNRFIRQLIPFLPNCKLIRGNSTLITLMLRKVFMEEGLSIKIKHETRTFTDEDPRYENYVDMELGNGYVGSTYSETVSNYEIYYWSDTECTADFLKLVDEMEMLRQFVKDWFLGIEEDLTFDIHHDEPPLRLNDDVFFNYLNYNTNI